MSDENTRTPAQGDEGDEGHEGEAGAGGFTWGITPRSPQPPVQSFDELLAQTDEPAAPGAASSPVPELPPLRTPVPEPEVHEVPTQPVASYDLPTQAYTPVDMAAQSEWDEISSLLGGAQPVDVGESAEHVFAPVATAATQVYRRAAGAIGATEDPVLVPTARGARRASSGSGSGLRILLYFGAGLVLALVGIAMFAVGRAAAGSGAAAVGPGSPVTTSSAPATPTIAPTGPLPAGTYAYGELRGGECIDTFPDAWQSRYTVVDCAIPHAAQLVLKAKLPADQYTGEYPGSDALASAVGKLCSRSGVLLMSAAGKYTGMQLETAFPADAADWAAGDRTYYCFADLADGGQLLASIQGTGPKS